MFDPEADSTVDELVHDATTQDDSKRRARSQRVIEECTKRMALPEYDTIRGMVT